MDENRVAKVVIELAIQIHRELGPGLLESVYETVLAHELRERGLDARRQVAIPIRYREIVFEEGFRADIVVHDKVLLELKCVARIHSWASQAGPVLPATNRLEVRHDSELQR